MSLSQAASIVQDASAVQHEINARDNVIAALRAELDSRNARIATLEAKLENAMFHAEALQSVIALHNDSVLV
jgi:BMFP domain-containing protein YqiC